MRFQPLISIYVCMVCVFLASVIAKVESYLPHIKYPFFAPLTILLCPCRTNLGLHVLKNSSALLLCLPLHSGKRGIKSLRDFIVREFCLGGRRRSFLFPTVLFCHSDAVHRRTTSYRKETGPRPVANVYLQTETCMPWSSPGTYLLPQSRRL